MFYSLMNVHNHFFCNLYVPSLNTLYFSLALSEYTFILFYISFELSISLELAYEKSVIVDYLSFLRNLNIRESTPFLEVHR